MHSITITRRSHDYHACITGEPGKWGCGRNPLEAVGNLVVAWPEEFQVIIRFPADQPGELKTEQTENYGN